MTRTGYNVMNRIGTLALVLVLVLSMVAMPVDAEFDSASTVVVGSDDEGAYVDLTNTNTTDAKTVDAIEVAGTNVTVGTSVPADTTSRFYFSSGTDDSANNTYYLALDSANYSPEDSISVYQADGTSFSISPYWYAEANSDETVTEGEQVSVSAFSNYSTNTISSYEWDFDGDGTVDANGADATHTFANAGTYTVELTATDDRGTSKTDVLTVTVEEPNSAPSADAGDNSTIDEGDSVTLNASNSSDSDGSISSYEWTDENGTVVGSNETVEVSPEEDTTYTLTVTDDSGATATDTVSVSVNPAYDVSITVEDNSTGDALANSTFDVLDSDDEVVADNVSLDENGTATVSLVDGTYTVDVDGYDSSSEFTVNGSAEDVTASLDESTTPSGGGGGGDSGGFDSETIMLIAGFITILGTLVALASRAT